MSNWEYAQLLVNYDYRVRDEAKWSLAWYAPGQATTELANQYVEIVTVLNRAGSAGWELINIEATDAQFAGPYNAPTDWALTRYTFRRLYTA